MRASWLLVLAVTACGSHAGHHDAGNGDGGIDAFAGPFPDFPPGPIIDTGAPADAPGLFGNPGSGAATGGPCMVEPEIGTLFPRNWLRPRFSWVPMGGENLFELRLTAANQINPLVVYTTATTWTMPAALWTALAQHTVDQPITMSIRGATLSGSTLASGPELGSKGPITVSSATAPGAIVYWTTSGGTGLRGFKIGDETVQDVVRPADASTACIGCHSSTPDGVFVGFSASGVATDGSPATLGMLSADGTKMTPSFITPSAQSLMARQQQEEPVFSKQHWMAGDHIAVTMFPINNATEIIWTDLEAASTAQGTGWGVLARTGDTRMAASAAFAHTTDTLIYTSTPTVGSGVTSTSGDIRTVPFNSRAGGTSTPLAGAATTAYNEYYPTFSPDDQLVAYNRVADGATSYNNAAAEVFVIPAAGGSPARIAANDPPACSGKTSPGVTNSWPKWAPGSTVLAGKTVYWLTFSSTRTGNPQLYVTPILSDGTTISTFPALYLWNQPAAENNHTPAWDDFGILQ